ncbi:DUF4382 domain-containing protein [Thalassotalea sp. PLHSN55]|uniref:DUF4382 domain-containing protein n=1 Tax=Thalassotalea sp. PLHSN55 TaxID=3435888 RepID=UPI003F858F54
MKHLVLGSLCLFLTACGSDNDSSSTEPPAPTTALVSFSISDAPVDFAESVNVTYSSITLKSDGDNEDDDSGLTIPILDENGNPTTITINLLDYQNGDEKLIISDTEIAIGEYSNLILNTSGCPQNQNGSTDSCWVEDDEGIKPLKTPSNKLKLGAFSVSSEAVQAYTIEFNLRSSLVETAGGASYNLKPHGVRVVDSESVGSIAGMVDVNLLNVGENCATVYEDNTDHGKVVYLYAGTIAEGDIMGDEFDPDTAQEPIADNVVMPFASDTLVYNDELELAMYTYHFAHLPPNTYTVAFSCSAVGDDSVEYNEITIADPAEQVHQVVVAEAQDVIQNFTETF